MKASEVAKLSLRKLDGLYDKVMHQIRQDALKGKSSTIYYIHRVNDDVDYSPLVARLKDDRFDVKYEKVYDQRDGNFIVFIISWKPHIMDADLARVQKELEEDSVETFDEMIEDLYNYAEKMYSLGKTKNEYLAKEYNTTANCARNIARRIEKTWRHFKKEGRRKNGKGEKKEKE